MTRYVNKRIAFFLSLFLIGIDSFDINFDLVTCDFDYVRFEEQFNATN